MALNKATLTSELAKVLDSDNAQFVGFPGTVSQAAQNFQTAYATYAAGATDVAGDGPTAVNAAGFGSALESGLANPSSLISVATAAFAAAFVAYWTGATFATKNVPGLGAPCASVGGNGQFSKKLSSSVSLVSPDMLIAALNLVFSSTSTSGSTRAAEMADAFHTATTTSVIVLIKGQDTTPPTTGPLAITNTCHLL